MGNVCGKKWRKGLIVGLSGAGKSSIVACVVEGKRRVMSRSSGHRNVRVNNLGVKLVDFSGKKKVRLLWKKNWNESFVVFVFDGTDTLRFPLACEEFLSTCEEKYKRGVDVIAVVSKTDCCDDNKIKQHILHISPWANVKSVSVFSGEGIDFVKSWMRGPVETRRGKIRKAQVAPI